MEWGVFVGWLEVMRRQAEPETASPHSWKGVENDPWWAEQRRKREEARAGR